MRPLTQAAFLLAGTLAAAGIGVAAFVGSGVYNIGADDHHTAIVLALIGQLRDRSIAVRAADVALPDLAAAGRVAAGAHAYAVLCSSCHLAPGVAKSPLRPGLYPHPPNLAQQAPPDTRRAFWIIKHGIKMSAMPAWGRTLEDGEIWDLVAFVREMPSMTPETYQQLLQ
jgi:mono/diheme cytochrome c family protein